MPRASCERMNVHRGMRRVYGLFECIRACLIWICLSHIPISHFGIIMCRLCISLSLCLCWSSCCNYVVIWSAIYKSQPSFHFFVCVSVCCQSQSHHKLCNQSIFSISLMLLFRKSNLVVIMLSSIIANFHLVWLPLAIFQFDGNGHWRRSIYYLQPREKKPQRLSVTQPTKMHHFFLPLQTGFLAFSLIAASLFYSDPSDERYLFCVFSFILLFFRWNGAPSEQVNKCNNQHILVQTHPLIDTSYNTHPYAPTNPSYIHTHTYERQQHPQRLHRTNSYIKQNKYKTKKTKINKKHFPQTNKINYYAPQ